MHTVANSLNRPGQHFKLNLSDFRYEQYLPDLNNRKSNRKYFCFCFVQKTWCVSVRDGAPYIQLDLPPAKLLLTAQSRCATMMASLEQHNYRHHPKEAWSDSPAPVEQVPLCLLWPRHAMDQTSTFPWACPVSTGLSLKCCHRPLTW